MTLANILHVVPFEVMGATTCVEASLSPAAVMSGPSSLGIADERTPFEREKAAFHARLPELKRKYFGQYVAIHNGQVAVYSDSENDVARRFFHEHPDEDVYIGFVGEPQTAYQIRPASRR